MDIHDSIDRILDSDVVIGDAFYDVFLEKYPQVQKYFEKVNLQRQAVLLTMAMLIIEQYASGSYPATERYLQDLGAKHREWGIPRETYLYFQDALLDTLERFHGDQWENALANQWREAIDQAIENMLKGYESTD